MDLPHGCDLAGAWMIGAVDRYTCLFFQRKLPSEETALRTNADETDRQRVGVQPQYTSIATAVQLYPEASIYRRDRRQHLNGPLLSIGQTAVRNRVYERDLWVMGSAKPPSPHRGTPASHGESSYMHLLFTPQCYD